MEVKFDPIDAGDSVFDDRFGVVVGEVVGLDLGNAEARLLVEGQVADARVAGGDDQSLQAAGLGGFDGVCEELAAVALALVLLFDGDVANLGGPFVQRVEVEGAHWLVINGEDEEAPSVDIRKDQ